MGGDHCAAGLVALGQALGSGEGLRFAGGAGGHGRLQGIQDAGVVLVAPLHQEVPAVGIGEVVSEAHPRAPGEQVIRVGQQVQRCVGHKRPGAVHVARIAGARSPAMTP